MRTLIKFKIFKYSFLFSYTNQNEYKRYLELKTAASSEKNVIKKKESLKEVIELGDYWNF
jgi:hypothetical protein